jgi:hypothetical protein
MGNRLFNITVARPKPVSIQARLSNPLAPAARTVASRVGVQDLKTAAALGRAV